MKKKSSNLQFQEKEVVSKRGVSSKTFQKKRGKFETKYYHKPIHQFDEISGCFIESAADKQNSKMTKFPGIIVKTEDAIHGEHLNVGKKGVRFDMNLPPRREGVITKKVNLLFHCKQAESPVEDSMLKLNRVSANGKECTLGMQKMQSGQTEYSFDVTSEYDVEEGTTYSLALVNGDDPEVTAVMTLSNTAVYSVEESDGKSEDDQPQGESGNIGSVGTYEVDVATGLLNVEMKGFAWEGNLMPISFAHTFRSLHRTEQCFGLTGWRMNLMQTMLESNNGDDELIYTDENEVTTPFSWKSCPDCVMYEDESGNIYNDTEKTLHMGGEQYKFNLYGLLQSVTDQNKNEMRFEYDVSQITDPTSPDAYKEVRIASLTDGAGRAFDFEYSLEQMVVYAPNEESIKEGYNIKFDKNRPHITYNHTNGRITSIVYPNGQTVNFEYDNAYLIKSIAVSDNGVLSQTTAFSYDGEKVVAISNGSNKSTTFRYLGSKQTVVKDVEAGLGEDANSEMTHYRVFFHEDSSKNFSYYDYADEDKPVVGDQSIIVPVSDIGMEINKLKAQNLLKAHVFDETVNASDEDASATSYSEFWHTNFQNNDSEKLHFDCVDNAPGYLSAKLISESKDNQGLGIWQNVTLAAEGSYVFSAYLRMSRKYTGQNGRAYLKVTDAAGNPLAVSEAITAASSKFVRVALPFTRQSNVQNYRVGIYVDGSTHVSVVAPQLEEGNYISPYNYISASNSTASVAAGASTLLASVMVNRDKSVKETFTVSANVAVDKTDENAFSGNFMARINCERTEEEAAAELPVFEEFSLPIYGSGFLAMQLSKTKYRGIKSIEIFATDVQNAFTISDLQLIRNHYEANLTEEDFIVYGDTEDEEATTSGAEMTVKDAISKRTEEEDIETIEAFEEAVDNPGNVLTGTNFKHGELGTIYTANGYSSDGNHRTSEIDARGNETKYEYDAATSKPTKVIDRCGNATQYEYDIAGRTTKVTAPNGGVVSYGYNSYDDLTQITRGDGQGYTMAYDAYRNLTQVKVGDQSLVDYTYNSGTNRLKSMTYANGSVQTLTYDRLGRLIGEKWTNGTTVEAHYCYFYDVSNNLEKTIDISNKRMYNVTTDGENVTAIAEYEFASINETTYAVSGLTLIGTMHYSFDGEGKQFRKKYVAADGTEQKYVFEFQDEQNVAVQLPTGVVSHSKSDHLGRKVFDELQLGKGLMNRTFTYHKGEITQAHLDNGKVVSNPETTLVKTIEFVDGRTIQYEYDAEERITKVIDSVDGTYEYTYDVLGQLLTEKKNGTTINTMTYDGYGNIKTKNGVAYTYDTTWKDKLTSYNGKTITYDAQGNPTNYMGTTLVWEKGRQLKQFGSNTYTYNNDGIRTSKTVGGVKHSYVLDGTNIVKETWGSNTLIPLYDLDGTVCGINYNGTAYYFYKNLQGDVVAITNDAGATVAKYTYDAWGKCTITSDTSGVSIATINPFRYRGYYYDEEIELYYLQSRYYDASIGRFVNGDDGDYVNVVGEPVTFNLYTYCNNEPISNADFTGKSLTAILIGVAIGAIIGGLAGYGLSRILKVPKGSRWKYVLGGAVIGAIIGGCIGYAVGAAGSSGIVLWSGGGMNGAGGHAMNFATKNGLRTLEMTTKGKFLSKMNTAAIKILGKSKGYKFMKPFWNAASKQFVKSAAGRQTYVNVFISASQFSEASVFAKIEYDIVRSLGLKIIWHFVQ